MTSLASPEGRSASPQIQEVITTSEGRLGLLGDWREVPPSSQTGLAVVFDLCLLSLSFFPTAVSFSLIMRLQILRCEDSVLKSLSQSGLAEPRTWRLSICRAENRSEFILSGENI